MSKTTAVIFDLGNTLVSYYDRAQWPAIQGRCLSEVADYLRGRGIAIPPAGEVAAAVEEECHEAKDFRVKPMEGRLARIFGLSSAGLAGGVATEMCQRFLGPIFALARRYDDVLPTLAELGRRRLQRGILSNTPWGSPAAPWREELARHGLLAAVEAVAFCHDVGWRKPAPEPFRFIMERLGVAAERCLFVGDDPRWDLAGPRAIGMRAILIDRSGSGGPAGETPITCLGELLERIDRG